MSGFLNAVLLIILYAIPLMIVALGGVFAERSGVINLGLEGGMIFGAFIAAVVCRGIITSNPELKTNQGIFLLGMVISIISGAIFSLLLSFSAINLKADQTIGGTALNMLAPAIVTTFGLMIPSIGSTKIDMTASFSLGGQNYLSTYVCVALFIGLSIWLYKSKIGIHLRACGEHPSAADSVGINVYKMRYLGTTISGALAGLWGYVYVCTSTGAIASSSVQGLGFLGLAIMIFGNWNPLLIGLGSLLFGFLKWLSVSANTTFLGALNLPGYFYNMLPYIIVIVVLVLSRNKSGVPKAEGIPYDKGAR